MQNNIYKGVNLGGWLILEKWITPSLFNDYNIEDEVTLSNKDSNYKIKILNHYNKFITKDDVLYLKSNNINSVRIPIAYWNYLPVNKFMSSEKYIDNIISLLIKNNISYIIDIHAAPGGQNKQDHSGKVKECNFDLDTNNADKLLNLIDYLTKKYKQNLIGIELLNEPDNYLNREFVYRYYKKANEIVYSNNNNLYTIISDEFRPSKIVQDLKKLNLKNAVLDMHLYQCFSNYDKKLSFEKHIYKTVIDWRKLVDNTSKYFPVIIGEWSLGLDNRTFKYYSQNYKDKALKIYLDSQQYAFKNSIGNYYWTYKTEDTSSWNFKFMVDNNLLNF